MFINLENPNEYSIKAYSDQQVTIGERDFANNFMVSKYGIISDWPVANCEHLTEENIAVLLTNCKPDLIIIGQNNYQFSFLPVRNYLAKLNIGLEIMSIGAACRTYTILLSEDREVALGVIFNA